MLYSKFTLRFSYGRQSRKGTKMSYQNHGGIVSFPSQPERDIQRVHTTNRWSWLSRLGPKLHQLTLNSAESTRFRNLNSQNDEERRITMTHRKQVRRGGERKGTPVVVVVDVGREVEEVVHENRRRRRRVQRLHLQFSGEVESRRESREFGSERKMEN